MTISRKGFVYRVAYPRWWSNHQPETISLCKLFWRFLMILFVAFPIMVVVNVFMAVMMFFIAYRVPNFFTEYSDFTHRAYRNWPTIRGHRVWPISLVPVGLLIWGILKDPADMEFLGIVIVGIAAIVAVACGIIFFFMEGIPAIRKSEMGQLVREYFKAKKQKICPLIRVTD